MDILKIIFVTLKRNIILAIALLVLAVVGGLIHYSSQTISYVSNFKTNNGFVDYSLFKSLTDFRQVTEEVYDLPATEIEAINTVFENSRISFLEETSVSISFTVVSKIEATDHKLIQDYVLKLINHNRFINNSYQEELVILKKKLAFLERKIAQLDTLSAQPTANINVSEVSRDSYDLYIEQLELEKELQSTGNYTLIKPVTELKTNKKPVTLFLALYLFLATFLFLILSKKVPSETTK